MFRTIPLAAALLATVACQQQSTTVANDDVAPPPVIEVPAGNKPAVPVDGPLPAPAPPVDLPPANSANPASAPAPVPPTPDSDKSVAAAKQVIDAYFAALATKRYADAYRMWGGRGEASGLSEPAFAASFAKYKIYDGTAFKPAPSEGAAGSIYVEFPVTVTGLLARGGGFHLSGTMTLRRVNDVDGSTAEQRRWHIASSQLK